MTQPSLFGWADAKPDDVIDVMRDVRRAASAGTGFPEIRQSRTPFRLISTVHFDIGNAGADDPVITRNDDDELYNSGNSPGRNGWRVI